MTYYDFYTRLPPERLASVLVRKVTLNDKPYLCSLFGELFMTHDEAAARNLEILNSEFPINHDIGTHYFVNYPYAVEPESLWSVFE